MKIKILLAALLTGNILFAQNNNIVSYLKDNTTSREHPLDILHMKLEVSFIPEQGKVIGKVTHSFKVLQKSVDSVFFDAPDIAIESALLNGNAVPFRIVKSGVWIIPSRSLNWDQTGEISFNYTAHPRKGIYFIGWNQPESDGKDPFRIRRQIWTQGQGIDNRYWIPMYDDMNDKFTTETITRFAKEYSVLSNGKFVQKKENKDGTVTWHYAMSHPHAGYLLMLGIGKYAVATAKSKSGVPLQYWYYPEFADRMPPTYRHTPLMMDFLEKETGVKYPWESYSQIMVQEFLYGAMENTTATVFGDFFNVDERAFLDRNYIGVNCHEMTHQWFGDFITARDGRDTWLQESFATYFPKQLTLVIDGSDEWNWQRRQQQNQAVEAGKKDNFPVRHTSGGTARVYPKGAAVISMLQSVLGEEQWKRVLTYYLTMHAYGNVETNDLQQAIKDKLGLNLDWFFDEWIYRGGEPHYRVHYEDLTYQDGSRATEIAVEQIQQMSETVHAFKMPVTLEVHYADGTFESVTEVLFREFEVVKIPNKDKKKIAFVLFDPNSIIIKQVTFRKSFDELQEQLEFAANLLDRYDALVALREIEPDRKREVLFEALKREKHYSMINEIISQLASDADMGSVSKLADLANHPSAAVRSHLFTSLPCLAVYKNSFVKALSDSSYDVVKTALEKLVASFPDEASVYLHKTDNVHGMSHAVRIKWIELSVVNSVNPDAAIRELTGYSSSLYEFRTRINSFAAIKAIGCFNEEVASNLFDAMLSLNGRLAAPAADCAVYFSASASNRLILKKVFNSRKFTDAEKESLIKFLPLLKTT